MDRRRREWSKCVDADHTQGKEIIGPVNPDVFGFVLQVQDSFLSLSVCRLCGPGSVRSQELLSPEINGPT